METVTTEAPEATAEQPSAAETNEELPAEQSPTEAESKVYAQKDDLGPENAVDEFRLPIRGVWVWVRPVESEEIMTLQTLPDLTGFTEMAVRLAASVAKEKAEDPDEDPDEREANKAARDAEVREAQKEQNRYYKYVAHLAIIDPDGSPDRARCADCGMEHRASLWTLNQVGRLHPSDLIAAGDFAVRHQLGVVGPFSEAP